MAEGKDRVNEAKEDRQKTLDKLGGDSEARTFKPKEVQEKEEEETSS